MAREIQRSKSLEPNSVALLDVLRAAAANLVLFGHADLMFGGNAHVYAGPIGVGVFFILSGFLIMLSSMARLQRPGPHLTPYLIDRFARVFTAYVPALVFVATVTAIIDLGNWAQPGIASGPVAFFGNLFLLQDFPLFQALHPVLGGQFHIRAYNTAEPFWTISIEFWIYVAFGCAFFGAAARERARPLLLGVLATVAVPVVLWNAAAGGGNGLSLVWILGAAVGYVWFTAWRHAPHKRALGLAVGFAAAACLAGRGFKIGWDFQDLGMAICETLLLVAAVSLVEGLPEIPRWARRACALVASYSYSLYLVHNTVMIAVRQCLSPVLGSAVIPVAIVAAHVAALVLYLLFERHHLRLAAMMKRLAARQAAPNLPPVLARPVAPAAAASWSRAAARNDLPASGPALILE